MGGQGPELTSVPLKRGCLPADANPFPGQDPENAQIHPVGSSPQTAAGLAPRSRAGSRAAYQASRLPVCPMSSQEMPGPEPAF